MNTRPRTNRAPRSTGGAWALASAVTVSIVPGSISARFVKRKSEPIPKSDRQLDRGRASLTYQKVADSDEHASVGIRRRRQRVGSLVTAGLVAALRLPR